MSWTCSSKPNINKHPQEHRRLNTARAMMLLAALLLGACANQPTQPSSQHLQQNSHILPQPPRDTPNIIQFSRWLPAPKTISPSETFNVVVNKVAVAEVLFTLARDAKLNIDIHPEVQGVVTLNAIQQTVPQLLQRISKQANIRYEWDHNSLIVLPDTPYLQHYKIDYVNISRDAESTIYNTMQVNSQGTQGNNNSSIAIRDISKNRFWETLIQNTKDILRETDQKSAVWDESPVVLAPAPTSKKNSNETSAPLFFSEASHSPRSNNQEKASVIANPENGVLSVRATSKQHQKIQEFFSQVLNSARRQVMIEITIVEVRLNDQYQQGINWSSLLQANGKDFKIVQSGNTQFGNGVFGILGNNGIQRQLALLSSFGNVKVLSSPKLSVLNNQTAMMRVVDNLVYFSVKADTVSNQNSATVTTYTTTPTTIPVGFTMSLTPQISDSNVVLLNVKPSISRLIQYVPDPNPNLLNIRYQGVPEIQTREMESLMRLENNQIAVMGGLMQDRNSQFSDQVPGLGKIPVVGEAFTQRNNSSETTELVIFLKPTVIKTASLDGDYRQFRSLLPHQQFFEETRHEKL